MKSPSLISVFLILLFSFQIICFTSCKKFVEVNKPEGQLNSDLVFLDSSAATSAVTGIYSEMFTNRNLFSNSSTTLYSALAADELYYYSPGLKDEFTLNQISQLNHINIDNSFWKPAYKFIYSANLAIEKLSKSSALSQTLKNQLMGESKFIRAFCFFHLVNLFGDIPLIISSAYNASAIAPRVSVSNIYKQIISDLNDAKNLLPSQYTTLERVRPNKWTACALLSSCYLYTDQWREATLEANALINSGMYSLEVDLNNVFLKTSTEAIWQLKPVRSGVNSYEGLEIIPSTSFAAPTYILSLGLRNAFEKEDKRKKSWLNVRIYNDDTLFFPFKYKLLNGTTTTEYYMVFRLAEQYLIRAEAELNQGEFSNARNDLNIIRNRAGLSNTLANDETSLKAAIEQERRIELFCEWAHRWYDLKRTGRANEVLAPLKGLNWQPTDVLWPIPQQEISLNPFLTQNAGY
ncbi:MAG: RagB/SusD family nutrient uptake outer membrane protein [Ginsengibacter sp.]